MVICTGRCEQAVPWHRWLWSREAWTIACGNEPRYEKVFALRLFRMTTTFVPCNRRHPILPPSADTRQWHKCYWRIQKGYKRSYSLRLLFTLYTLNLRTFYFCNKTVTFWTVLYVIFFIYCKQEFIIFPPRLYRAITPTVTNVHISTCAEPSRKIFPKKSERLSLKNWVPMLNLNLR